MDTNIELYSVVRTKEKEYVLVQKCSSLVILLEIAGDNMKFVSCNAKVLDTVIGDYEVLPPLELPAIRATVTDADMREISEKAEAVNRFLASFDTVDKLVSKTRKPTKEIEEVFLLNYRQIFRYIKRYLLYGRNPFALVDRRRLYIDRAPAKEKVVRGRKRNDGVQSMVINDENLKTSFEKAITEFKENAFYGVTAKQCWDNMLRHDFAKPIYKYGKKRIVLNPDNMYPSYSRFLRALKKAIAPATIAQYKAGKMDAYNNERILPGTVAALIDGPGRRIEVDEVEFDAYLISRFSNDGPQDIGRPVMYCAVDTYSSIIVGCYVGFHNNCYEGLLNLLLTMFEPHNKQTARYGIECTPEEYPSCFLPEQITSDNGAEYLSKAVEAICEKIPSQYTAVPAGTGSMKPLVEQGFHRIQNAASGPLAKAGYIQKKKSSTHMQDATLTIDDFWKIALILVLQFNTMIREQYMPSKEMAERVKELNPISLWQYGCETFGSPRALRGKFRDECLFSLFKNDRNFKVSERGIYIQDLIYYAPYDWLINMMRKTAIKTGSHGPKSMKLKGVRYDPRSIASIYYKADDGKIYEIPLDEYSPAISSYSGLSWAEQDARYKQVLALRKGSRHKNTELRINSAAAMEAVVTEAKARKPEGKNATKNIREARLEEKSIQNVIDVMQSPKIETAIRPELEAENQKALNGLLDRFIEPPSDEDEMIYTVDTPEEILRKAGKLK